MNCFHQTAFMNLVNIRKISFPLCVMQSFCCIGKNKLKTELINSGRRC